MEYFYYVRDVPLVRTSCTCVRYSFDSFINAEPNKSIQEIARALTGSLISVKVPYHVAFSLNTLLYC